MKKLNKFATVMAKVLEIMFWIGDAIMVVLFIASIAITDKITSLIQKGLATDTLTISGFDIQVFEENSAAIAGTITLAAISGIISCGLIAMIFRNIYLIFKKSEQESPFAKDNIRMVREIGIFAIALPVVDLILSIIGRMIINANAVEISVSFNSVIFGIIILCLSQFFAYGAQL